MIKKTAFIICILFICVSFFVFQSLKTGDKYTGDALPETPLKENTVQGEQKTQSVEKPLGKAVMEKEKYYIYAKDNKLFAYCVEGEKKSLVKEAEVSFELLPKKEKEMLKDGIYAGTYEELCMLWEAYIS